MHLFTWLIGVSHLTGSVSGSVEVMNLIMNDITYSAFFWLESLLKKMLTS